MRESAHHAWQVRRAPLLPSPKAATRGLFFCFEDYSARTLAVVYLDHGPGNGFRGR